jgi:hypothetical protein
MKRSLKARSSHPNGLRIFAGPDDKLEGFDQVVERAHEEIEEIKQAYRNKTLSFDYNDEIVAGEFVTAIEGDFPGTYMIVLRVPSSRVFSGPCFVHLHGERIGGIVVTAKNGLVGITAKAIPQKRATSFSHSRSALAKCA